MAWADRQWVLDGAAVRVSMVGFDAGIDTSRYFDGRPAGPINANLTIGDDLGQAKPLGENAGIAFMGDTKGGAFDVPHDTARKFLGAPNPNRKPNSDVVRPWVNGLDISRRDRAMWIIDYGCTAPYEEAAGYEVPMTHVEHHVKPERINNRREAYAKRWWIHVEPRPALRTAVETLPRFVCTPNLTKHRMFGWVRRPTVPDHQLIAYARSDDYFFGVLHSSIHELWALRMGTQLEDRPRYTPTTCFETFPLPWPPGKEPADHPAWTRISDAARELNEQRERWLNPPEWIEPLARLVDAADGFADVPPDARPLIRRSAIMARAAKDPNLKKRTLTNLYNQRPAWLRLAHEKLDRAVLAAYAATDPGGGWSQDWALVWIERGAGRPLDEGHADADRRAEVERSVLGNLLRMNQQRV